MSLLFAVDISSSINFLNVFLHYSICIYKIDTVLSLFLSIQIE
jgi:hypothetical protein